MYHQNAERLVRAGLRVVVIEQIETPEQLKARNEGRQKAEKKVITPDRGCNTRYLIKTKTEITALWMTCWQCL